MRRNPAITLLTDFGTSDAYVGVVKGVILGLAPGCTLVDLTHEVPPQAVSVAALLLGDALPYFPPGTVHLAVVDPGVGTGRRAICVESERAIGIGPDNGVLTALIARSARVVEIQDERLFLSPVSATFHGRDVFAPVAARLALGLDLDALGPRVYDPVRVEVPSPRREGDALVGEVLHVDRFGNLITTIAAANLAGWLGVEVEVGGARISGLSRTYAAGTDGVRGGNARGGDEAHALCALFGSSGRLEIALAGGSAARAAGVGRGAPVVVRRRGHV